MSNLKIYGDHDARTIGQMQRCMAFDDVIGGVLCADGHLGYSQPVGGVVAHAEHISVSGVGYDIGCGNTAIRLDVKYTDIAHRIPEIAADIARTISFGVGRTNDERVDCGIFDWYLWDNTPATAHLKVKAREQLGTVGSGNHYVDIFVDTAGYIWIGVHFGSRGLGHQTATTYLKLAGGKDGIDEPPTLLHQDSDLGRQYLAAMEIAGEYAREGREWVCNKVRSIIGGSTTFFVNNHHNYAWRERHGDTDAWVIRKGATPAFPGQEGFVGGSMGDDAVILQGVDAAASEQALFSTVHGAGRVMSRTQARGKFVKIDGKKVRQPGLVRHDDMQRWVRDKGVFVIGGDVDESPQAYRRLPEVLKHHEGTVDIIHTLRPIIVVMAGSDVVDPYKD